MILDRFRAQLEEIAAYVEMAERRGDGVQVILTADPGAGAKQAKVTAYAAPFVPKRKQA